MGKRCEKIGEVGTPDVGDDLRHAVVQEEPGSKLRGVLVDAGEAEVRPPGAAAPDAEGVVEAQVAATLWTAGERGGGRKNPSRRLASLHARCSHLRRPWQQQCEHKWECVKELRLHRSKSIWAHFGEHGCVLLFVGEG